MPVSAGASGGGGATSVSSIEVSSGEVSAGSGAETESMARGGLGVEVEVESESISGKRVGSGVESEVGSETGSGMAFEAGSGAEGLGLAGAGLAASQSSRKPREVLGVEDFLLAESKRSGNASEGVSEASAWVLGSEPFSIPLLLKNVSEGLLEGSEAKSAAGLEAEESPKMESPVEWALLEAESAEELPKMESTEALELVRADFCEVFFSLLAASQRSAISFSTSARDLAYLVAE